MPPAEQEVLLLDLDLSDPGWIKVGVMSRLAAPAQWGKHRSAESEFTGSLDKSPAGTLGLEHTTSTVEKQWGKQPRCINPSQAGLSG